jgi:hypothetical protein
MSGSPAWKPPRSARPRSPSRTVCRCRLTCAATFPAQTYRTAVPGPGWTAPSSTFHSSSSGRRCRVACSCRAHEAACLGPSPSTGRSSERNSTIGARADHHVDCRADMSVRATDDFSPGASGGRLARRCYATPSGCTLPSSHAPASAAAEPGSRFCHRPWRSGPPPGGPFLGITLSIVLKG